MATTKFYIPKTDAVIKCRNKREQDMALHFLLDIEIYAEIEADGNDDYLWSRCETLDGYAHAMMWCGMIDGDAPRTSAEYVNIIRELAADIKAGNTPNWYAPAEI